MPCAPSSLSKRLYIAGKAHTIMNRKEAKMSAADLLVEFKQEVTRTPPAEIPTLLGNLEEMKATAWARLTEATNGGALSQADKSDELLDVKEAAHRLNLSEDHLYRNSNGLPFTVRIGRRLRFSAQGIERFIRQRQNS